MENIGISKIVEEIKASQCCIIHYNEIIDDCEAKNESSRELLMRFNRDLSTVHPEGKAELMYYIKIEENVLNAGLKKIETLTHLVKKYNQYVSQCLESIDTKITDSLNTNEQS